MEKDHLEIILESIDNKFQLVLEGHSSLANQIAELRQETNERFDLVDFKFQVLNDKIDAVATDLQAHRADTEAHGGKGLYVVREG
jgi:hypothetical protein